MVTLYNVIDIRTGQIHSVAIIKEQHAKYFIDAETEPEEEEER